MPFLIQNAKNAHKFNEVNIFLALEECKSDMKRCEHGMCISKSLWCNGVNDCGDFSDEENCDNWKHEQVEITCGDGESKLYQCKNNKTICLQMSKRCDGKADCPKGRETHSVDLHLSYFTS